MQISRFSTGHLVLNNISIGLKNIWHCSSHFKQGLLVFSIFADWIVHLFTSFLFQLQRIKHAKWYFDTEFVWFSAEYVFSNTLLDGHDTSMQLYLLLYDYICYKSWCRFHRSYACVPPPSALYLFVNFSTKMIC